MCFRNDVFCSDFQSATSLFLFLSEIWKEMDSEKIEILNNSKIIKTVQLYQVNLGFNNLKLLLSPIILFFSPSCAKKSLSILV